MSAEELCELVDAFGDEDVGVTWDFGHGRMMIANQSTALERIGSRLKATHVQDNKGTDAHLIPFVGGDINWESIMPTLKKIGYDGTFMLEAGSFSANIPEALWEDAGRLAYEFGQYCLSLAEK
jgi:sugar phosphate isomerase/epimerase